METLCAICCRGLNSILFFQVTDMVYDNSTAIQVPCPRSQFTQQSLPVGLVAAVLASGRSDHKGLLSQHPG